MSRITRCESICPTDPSRKCVAEIIGGNYKRHANCNDRKSALPGWPNPALHNNLMAAIRRTVKPRIVSEDEC